jgi:hypothetical protein
VNIAQEYLNQIRLADVIIQQKLDEIENLQTLATKTTTVLGDDRVQSSSDQQKMAKCVVNMVMLKEELQAEINRLLDLKQEALELINKSCSPDCIKLLYKRYFEFKKWETIAVELNYTYQWVSDGLHKKALRQMQKNCKNLKELIKVDRS